ncbi:hypothetical protein [Streptomyces sp. NPDC050804]|uniref:hypothetical protein n=1 Tax=Streptomyces sp. NPDC050804 TaxID=3154745 RepID=UPI003438C615
MNNREVPDRLPPVVVGTALTQAGVVFAPLMSKRYLRDLARYRLMLASSGELSSGRTTALVKWWHTLMDVMALHQRAMNDMFWSCLHTKGPQFDGVINAMHGRFETLDASRTEAGHQLVSALKLQKSPQSAQVSFIRFQEEMTAASLWEEREGFSQALRHFTPADWRRVESYVLALQAAEDNLNHVLPWLLDGLPEEESHHVLSAFPESMLETYRSVWLPCYERFSRETWPGMRTG